MSASVIAIAVGVLVAMYFMAVVVFMRLFGNNGDD
jgi:hypothetical protein